MKMIVLTVVLLALSGFAAAADAQGARSLQSLMNGSVQVPDAEDGFDDLQTAMVESFGLRPKPPVIIRMTEEKDAPILRRISAMMDVMDSTDLMVGICRGGWEPDASVAEFARLISPTREKITVDYLFHAMQFFPAQNGVLFIIPPVPQELSASLFQGGEPTVDGGGKYIVVLRFRGQSDYPTVLESFDDVIAGLSSVDQADRNKDGEIAFSEWLQECRRRLEKTFVAQVYKITSAPDLPVKQLR